MTDLRIAADFSLPAEAVTQTFAILAKRGVGKTYCASVLVEELLKAGLHAVVVDPVGVWWGLRAAADGKRPGLPIVILGGDHGDVPLELTAGQVIADLVVDEGISAVLDLSLFRNGSLPRGASPPPPRLGEPVPGSPKTPPTCGAGTRRNAPAHAPPA